MVLWNATMPPDRMQCALAMLTGIGTYGLVTELSRIVGVSRQTLYTWKEIAQQALAAALGPAPLVAPTVGPGVALERAILTLWVEGPMRERGIQHGLAAVGFGEVSLGTIAAVVAEAQHRALAWFATLQAPASVRAIALDEAFVARRKGAALSIVDARSLAVWQSVGPVAVDTESWVLLLWEAQARELRWDQTESDGGGAITGACLTVDPAGCHGRDVWHILHQAGQVQGRIDTLVTRLGERTATVERQAARVAAGQPPRGRNPVSDVAAHAAEVAARQRVADGLTYLRAELRRLLDVVVVDHRGVLGLAERQQELEALLALLAEVAASAAPAAQRELAHLHTTLQHALSRLIAWAGALDAVHAAAAAALPAGGLALLGWAWQRRETLGPTVAELVPQVPEAWRAAATAVLTAWDETVRTSSAAENWHSILRPHLLVRRRLTPGLLALVAVWHNHRVFERGARKGQNPLQVSGISAAPTDWLVALGYPPATPVERRLRSYRQPVELPSAA